MSDFSRFLPTYPRCVVSLLREDAIHLLNKNHLQGDDYIRVLPEGSITTLEYDDRRVNVYVNDKDEVVNVNRG